MIRVIIVDDEPDEVEKARRNCFKVLSQQTN